MGRSLARPATPWRRLVHWLWVGLALSTPLMPPVDLIAELRAAGALGPLLTAAELDAELRALLAGSEAEHMRLSRPDRGPGDPGDAVGR